MDSITVRSYAKVNLTLEVSSRREDGFHNIDSVVQVIDLADEITVARAGRGVVGVKTDTPDVPDGKGNIAYRACEAFFSTTGTDGGAECAIHKTIPAQAGLGGGSSNAAAVVAALDKLYGTGLGQSELAAIAAQVGSDAALFVYGGTLRMEGRGDMISPLPDAPELNLVIAKPSVGVPTAWAYAELDRLGACRATGASRAAEDAIASGDRHRLVAAMFNAFDDVISEAKPEIRDAHSLLKRIGAEKTMLCGSGSAVLGVFESRQAAEAAVGMADANPAACLFVASGHKRQS